MITYAFLREEFSTLLGLGRNLNTYYVFKFLVWGNKPI